MPKEPIVTTLSGLSASTSGVFRADAAAGLGVSRNQLTRLAAQGIVERVLPGTYRMTAVSASGAQRLRAAMAYRRSARISTGSDSADGQASPRCVASSLSSTWYTRHVRRSK